MDTPSPQEMVEQWKQRVATSMLKLEAALQANPAQLFSRLGGEVGFVVILPKGRQHWAVYLDGDLVRVTQREAVDPVLRIGIEPRALRWMVEGTLDVQQAFKDKRVALEDPDLLIRRFVACFEPAGSALGLRLGASKPRKTR